jgi:phosphoribosylglycinamide formyltransferase-1
MAEQRLDLIAPNRVALDGKLLDAPLQLRHGALVD